MTDIKSKFNSSAQSPQGTKGGQATTMAELMAKNKKSFVTLKKGGSVKGKITKLTSNEILVDVGAKTETLVLEKDKRILHTLLAMFKVGDTVDVNVLNPESDIGQPIVSLRRYLGNMAWKKLEDLQKSKEFIAVIVADVAKAGYVVNTDFGVSGFLPQSHASFSQQQDIAPGQKLKVSVLEINKEDNKIIFSQKTTITEENFSKTMKQFKVGQTVEVTISNVTPFGIFVILGSIEGFIHISEASWDKITDLSGMFTSGQKIDAVIIRFDSETRRVNLSIKRLSIDPFEALIEQFPIDKKITGKVTKVEDTGVTVNLTDEVEGYIKKEKIPPTTTYTVGQSLTVLVSEYDKKRHKIILTPVLLEKPLGYR